VRCFFFHGKRQAKDMETGESESFLILLSRIRECLLDASPVFPRGLSPGGAAVRAPNARVAHARHTNPTRKRGERRQNPRSRVGLVFPLSLSGCAQPERSAL
jgi:hypothetical protein